MVVLLEGFPLIAVCVDSALKSISTSIGAGTGPAGQAMAGPFLAKVETKVCVRLLCGLIPRLNYCSKFPAEYVRKCARIRLTFRLAWGMQ